MIKQNTPNNLFLTVYLAKSAGIFTAIVGSVVLLGWVLNISFLKSIVSGFATMKPNTALSFIFCGAALWILSEKGSIGYYKIRIARVLAALAALIGLLTLVEYVLDLTLIDLVLFRETLLAGGGEQPGRMSIITALNFFLLGVSLLSLDLEIWRWIRPSQWFSIFVALMCFIAIISYAYDVRSLYQVFPFSTIAIHTAITFFVLSVGLLFVRGDQGLTAIFLQNTPGGILIRRMLPAALIIPFFLGWLRLKGEQAGLYGMEFGIALFAASNILIFTTLIWRSAILLDQTDKKRRVVENTLTESLKDLADLKFALDESAIVAITDPIGKITYVNDKFCEISGFSRDELIGQNHQIIDGDFHTKDFIRDIRSTIESGLVWHGETKNKTKNDSSYWVDTTLVPFLNEQGKPYQYVAIRTDITERKRAEKKLRESEELVKESEKQLRRVLDNLFIFVGLALPDGSLVEVNRGPLEAAGISLEDVFGKKAWETVFVNHNAAVSKQMEEDYQKAAQGEIIRRDIDLQISDGKIVTVDYMLAPVRDDHGNITHLLSSGADITDRKQMENALRFEKERLEKTAAVSPGIIYSYRIAPDLTPTFPFASPGIYEIYGKTPEELKENASVINEVIHPDDLKKLSESIRKSAVSMTPWYDVWRVINPQKGEIWVEGYSAPALEPDGNITWHGVMTDVTERKKTEDQIVESEQRYRLMFENNPLPMWVYDLETLKFLAVNEAAIQHYGYAQKEFLAMTLRDIRPAEDHSVLLNDVAGVNSKLGKPLVRRHLKSDGTLIDIEIISHGLLFAGRSSRLVLANDITERNRAEQMILELNETLERKVAERTVELEVVNKELEAFSYSVSHDLRAPLRAMDGFSLALLEDYEDQLDEDGQNYLRRVRAASQKMAQLIDDLLKLSRVSRGELHREKTNLSAIVKEITDELREAQPKSSVNLKIEEDVLAFVDERLLRAALENLLNNAWKFTSKKENAEISFGQMAEKDEAIYFVTDNGAGFDMQYAGKLFGAFQRLHTSSEFEGTGVGLATVQRIISRHGGKIWVDSKVDQGTTFYFKFSK